jgi:hypothetical protein
MGNGQGSVSYIGNGKCEVTEGDYKTEIKCGTVRTPAVAYLRKS